MNYSEHVDKLGFKAEDKVTGQSGTITHVGFDLYGCTQVILTWQKEDKSIETGWFDIDRLIINGENPVMQHPFNLSKSDRVDNAKSGGFDKPTK